jgi:hypothetical protein
MIYSAPNPRLPNQPFLPRKFILRVEDRSLLFSKSLPKANPEYNNKLSTEGEAAWVVDSFAQQKMLELRKISGFGLYVWPADPDEEGVMQFLTSKEFVGDAVFVSQVLEFMAYLADRLQRYNAERL